MSESSQIDWIEKWITGTGYNETKLKNALIRGHDRCMEEIYGIYSERALYAAIELKAMKYDDYLHLRGLGEGLVGVLQKYCSKELLIGRCKNGSFIGFTTQDAVDKAGSGSKLKQKATYYYNSGEENEMNIKDQIDLQIAELEEKKKQIDRRIKELRSCDEIVFKDCKMAKYGRDSKWRVYIKENDEYQKWITIVKEETKEEAAARLFEIIEQLCGLREKIQG